MKGNTMDKSEFSKADVTVLAVCATLIAAQAVIMYTLKKKEDKKKLENVD